MKRYLFLFSCFTIAITGCKKDEVIPLSIPLQDYAGKYIGTTTIKNYDGSSQTVSSDTLQVVFVDKGTNSVAIAGGMRYEVHIVRDYQLHSFFETNDSMQLNLSKDYKIYDGWSSNVVASYYLDANFSDGNSLYYSYLVLSPNYSPYQLIFTGQMIP